MTRKTTRLTGQGPAANWLMCLLNSGSDLYDPGRGRRVQIRDTSRRIIGYVERDGTVTNTSRQRIETV